MVRGRGWGEARNTNTSCYLTYTCKIDLCTKIRINLFIFCNMVLQISHWIFQKNFNLVKQGFLTALCATSRVRDRSLFMAWGWRRREMFFLINFFSQNDFLPNLKYQLKNKHPPLAKKFTKRYHSVFTHVL